MPSSFRHNHKWQTDEHKASKNTFVGKQEFTHLSHHIPKSAAPEKCETLTWCEIASVFLSWIVFPWLKQFFISRFVSFVRTLRWSCCASGDSVVGNRRSSLSGHLQCFYRYDCHLRWFYLLVYSALYLLRLWFTSGRVWAPIKVDFGPKLFRRLKSVFLAQRAATFSFN